MKIDFKKIDFRQGKYWFPLVLFVPLVAIAYFSCEMFKGTGTQEGMVTDSINTMMPEPAGDGLHNKFAAMVLILSVTIPSCVPVPLNISQEK